MNYKKIAQVLKSSSRVLIWRKSENEYWVTNTYFLIKIEQENFNKMKAKYGSYKRTPYIKELEIDEFFKVYENSITDGEKPDFESIIDEENIKKAIVTKLMINDGDNELIFVVDNEFGLINSKYFNLFGYGKKYKTQNTKSPLLVYENDKIIGLIMPIDNSRLNGLDGLDLLKADLLENK